MNRLAKCLLPLLCGFFAAALTLNRPASAQPATQTTPAGVAESVSQSSNAGENDAELARLLTPLIEAHRGKVAVAIQHLKTGQQFRYAADEVMPTASLIKLPVMVEAYRQLATNRLDSRKVLTLQDSDKVPGSGVLTANFSQGTQISLYDAIRLMIAYSDNTATNLVIDQIGLGSTTQAMRELGCPNTRLHAKVFRRDTSIAPERSRQYGLGSTTANETLSLLIRLDAGELINSEACRAMLTHLYACDDRSKIPRDLPATARVAHKTGAVARSRCDAGLIDSPSGRIAICILTTDNEDHRWTDDNEANRLCGTIAKIAYDYLNQDPQASTVTPDLAVGTQGGMVETLQRTLNARLPGLSISVDGDFGPQTEEAVIRFQQQQGLEAHGRVDAATWAALSPLIEEGPEPLPPAAVNTVELPREPADPLNGPPFVSCRAWAIMDAGSGELLFTNNAGLALDMASTTKIMTAVVALRTIQQHPELAGHDVVFSQRADETVGSTSGVRAGEIVTLDDLLYGLLLPSGNDASVAIGEYLGQWMLTVDAQGNGGGQAGENATEQDPLLRFVAAMNQTSRDLQLNETQYRNTHGLTEQGHHTSAQDLAKLTRYALSMPRFREIVATRQRGCTLRSEQGYTRNVVWKNTNRLLEREGYAGVKTGTTRAAGACLVSLAQRNGRELIVATLGSASSTGRYVDTRNLLRWAWTQLADEAVVTAGPSGPVVLTSQARRLHGQSLLVDGHNDLPWRFREMGMPSFDDVDIAKPQQAMHTDIPRLREGGVGAQFWSVYVPVSTADDGKALLTTLEQIQLVHSMVERYPETFHFARSHDDILQARNRGKIACLIGVEGGHCIENSLNVLRQLHQQGARYMTLTHSSTLDWADSATDDERHDGLTPFGEEVVREMNRLGMMVDLSHVSVATMNDALQVSKAPVIYSHSSARAIADHPRNVPDDVLRRVAGNGGVVMVNFYSSFVVPSSAQRSVARMAERKRLEADGRTEQEINELLKRWEARHPVDLGNIYNVVDHIEHIAKVAGIDHVGLGSDYDGIDQVPNQLEDVSTYPRITQELINRGYDHDSIKKILGGNVMRVLRDVEMVSRKLNEAPSDGAIRDANSQ